MRHTLLATDYDGTLATDGIVEDAVVQALRAARLLRLRLVLVTGRELPSLFQTFAHVDLFDLVVAENGAVLYDPVVQRVDVIAAPPPPELLNTLQLAEVPISVGHSIVATTVPYEAEIRAAIAGLGLDWHLVFNKRAVMALPATVSKATGLAAALAKLGVPADETIGVGDAENDLAFMEQCGLAVAVANALPQVKHVAHVVLGCARGAGVIELFDRLRSGELDAAATSSASQSDVH